MAISLAYRCGEEWIFKILMVTTTCGDFYLPSWLLDEGGGGGQQSYCLYVVLRYNI
jgi:hypothetical protein